VDIRLTDVTAQILTNVLMNTKMTVILTPCVPIPKDPTSASVIEASREMVRTAQMWMNVQVLRQTNVIPTPCVPTLKDPTSAAVFEATKKMAELAPM